MITILKHMTNLKKIVLFSSSLVISIFFCLSFVSCNKTMAAEDAEVFKDITNSMTENYFISINEGDYEKFSKDFDDGMKKAITKENFIQSICPIKDELGEYIPNSIRFVTMANEQGYTAVYYDADFVKQRDIKIKMVFSKINDEYKISGQWFQ